MKTVNVDMLRKRYLFHAEIKASEEIDSLINELKKYDYSEENVFTKDEVVAMLKEIQMEVEELKNEPACCHHFVRGIRRSSEVIQQKIDALKADKEGRKWE